jgi:hypothetical protein
MSEQPHHTASTDDAPPGMPRWVKLSARVVAAIILLGIVAMLLAGGDHGPSRHAQASVGPTAPAVTLLAASGMRADSDVP